MIKKFGGNKIVKVISIVIAAAIVLEVGIVGFSAVGVGTSDGGSGSGIGIGIGKLGIVDKIKDLFNAGEKSKQNEAAKLMLDKETKFQKTPKKKVDINSINLSKEDEDLFRRADSSKFDKNFENYKKIILERNVNDSYKNEMKRHIKAGKRVSKVFAAYEFLGENYGKISELDGLLKSDNLEEAFANYTASHPEFKPQNFDKSYLDELLKTPGITHDDIFIADIAAFYGKEPFQNIIDKRKKGLSWKEIKSELGMVNLEESIPHTRITSRQVDKYMTETGLDKDRVMKALVLSDKFDLDENSILTEYKNGKKDEKILGKSLQEKYN